MRYTIASDLDGTLLNSERRLGHYSRDVLRWISAQGHTVLLASGRHYIDMAGIRDVMDMPLYLISSNGAQITSPKDDVLHCHALPADLVSQLLPMAREHGVHINLHFQDRWLVEAPKPELLAAHRDSGFAYQVVDLAQENLDGVIKLFFIGKPKALRAIAEQVKTLPLHEQLQMVFAESTDLQFMAKDTSKRAALERVLADIGATRNSLIAFGDGMNDREMLQLAGHGLVMANAMPELKQSLPAHPVIGHHSQEAVAVYLADYFGYPQVVAAAG